MKKSNLILLGVILALAIAIGVLASINAGEVKDLEPASLVVKVNGQEIGSISLEEMVALGGEEFDITLRSSQGEPRENTYLGLPLSTILEAVDQDILSQGEQVTVRAIDGYAVAYTMEEVMQSDHIYLVWRMDGDPLGNKSDGGSGPLLVIPRQDEFGQRWCKFAVEVDIR